MSFVELLGDIIGGQELITGRQTMSTFLPGSLQASEKGLVNNPGENNCFLNAAVQVLT